MRTDLRLNGSFLAVEMILLDSGVTERNASRLS
jgi:hypothetical protein